MDMKLGDGIKKLILVGIGAAAATAEKSQQIVEDLVKKGEITVEQGKELNQELKRNVKKRLDEISAAAQEKDAEIKETVEKKEEEIKIKKCFFILIICYANRFNYLWFNLHQGKNLLCIW